MAPKPKVMSRQDRWGDILRPILNGDRTNRWLIGPICDSTAWAWMDDAVCVGTDPEAWFAGETQYQQDILSRLCNTCPVKSQCLDHALKNNELGWWGGTTELQRRHLKEVS